MIFSLKDLLERVKKNEGKKRLAIAAADDLFIVRAVKKMMELGLITPIFIGNKENIRILLAQEELLLEDEAIIETVSDQESASVAINLVREKQADMLMKGLLPTKIFMLEVFHNSYGLARGNLLSHLALFESPFYQKVIGVTDAALNVSPDFHDKIKIIQNAVNVFEQLGIKMPKVALLAAVEKVNPKMQATLDAARIVEMHNESKIAPCYLEGPMALDLAISSEAAEHKRYTSTVSGDVDILIMPEITSGNVLYKSLTYLGGARTAGLIIGAKCPIILTSRADDEDSKLYSIALALNLI
jgi:phosphate butyryltransferase